MLILSRRMGERVRIVAPAGEVIWLTQGDGHVLASSDADFMHAYPDQPVRITMANGDFLTIHCMSVCVHGRTRARMRRPGIGIEAPRHYDILREELIEDYDSGRRTRPV